MNFVKKKKKLSYLALFSLKYYHIPNIIFSRTITLSFYSLTESFWHKYEEFMWRALMSKLKCFFLMNILGLYFYESDPISEYYKK